MEFDSTRFGKSENGYYRGESTIAFTGNTDWHNWEQALITLYYR